MRNFFSVIIFLLVGAVQAETAPELAMLDGLRTGNTSVKVVTRIEVDEPNEPLRSSLLDVYAHEDGRSLAVYRSDREAGQKVLMVDDQFWLFMPSSKRALRITPMQKLLGEASVGDVASLAWSEDYDVIDRQILDGRIQLRLEANRNSLSYQSITLIVDADTLHPIAADFYLKSGKLAKQATFDVINIEGEWLMRGLSLSDQVQKQQVTRIIYEQVEPMTMPEKWFTPGFLLRSTP